MSQIENDDDLLDFDAEKVRREQAASGKKPPRTKIGGQVYNLPIALPASFFFVLGRVQSGDLSKLETLVDDVFGKAADGIKPKLDAEDIAFLLRELPKKYGINEGESGGSTPS